MGNAYERRVKGYSDFISSSRLDEGVVDTVKDAVAKMVPWLKGKLGKLKGWTGEFFRALAEGRVKTITKGPNRGKPAAMLFLQENGSIAEQCRRVYGGASANEAVVPLEWSGPDQDISVGHRDAEGVVKEIKLLWHRAIGAGKTGKDRTQTPKPVFIFGAPGVGKTSLVAEAADQLGVNLMCLQIDMFGGPEDLLGVPTVEGGTTKNNPPSVLPRDCGENGKGGILFLDELNAADPKILRALNQFIQLRTISDYTLPKCWIIVAAGNRPDTGEREISDIDPSLSSRFRLFNYVPQLGIDPETRKPTGHWSKWASEKGLVLPEVIYYLASNPEKFYHLDTEQGRTQFPCPRSWVDACANLQDYIDMEGLDSWRDVDPKTLRELFEEVGVPTASDVVQFLEIMKEFTENDVEMAMKSPMSAKMVQKFKQEKKSCLYAIAADMLNKAATPEQIANIVVYINRYGEDEITMWIIKEIRRRHEEFTLVYPEYAGEPGYDKRMVVQKIASDIARGLGKKDEFAPRPRNAGFSDDVMPDS